MTTESETTETAVEPWRPAAAALIEAARARVALAVACCAAQAAANGSDDDDAVYDAAPSNGVDARGAMLLVSHTHTPCAVSGVRSCVAATAYSPVRGTHRPRRSFLSPGPVRHHSRRRRLTPATVET